MKELQFVAYCGLYCKLCAQCGRIPAQAQALHDSMNREGYPYWGKDIPNFESFWDFLGNLADETKQCEGCRSGACGYPFCEIRSCAIERDVVTCPLCKDFPCKQINALAEVYPTLVADGQHLREMGLEDWIEIQEKRVAAGFCYADIRHE